MGQFVGHFAISQLIYTTLRYSRKSSNEGDGTATASAGDPIIAGADDSTGIYTRRSFSTAECDFG